MAHSISYSNIKRSWLTASQPWYRAQDLPALLQGSHSKSFLRAQNTIPILAHRWLLATARHLTDTFSLTALRVSSVAGKKPQDCQRAIDHPSSETSEGLQLTETLRGKHFYKGLACRELSKGYFIAEQSAFFFGLGAAHEAA